MKEVNQYKILVVDDDPNIIELIVETLENDHFDFLQSNSVQEAIEIANLESIDLIITDWVMPTLTGIDLIKHFRSSRFGENIGIIMVTGINTSNDLIKVALESGADDFIKKPFHNLELNARANSVLRFYDAKKKQLKAEKEIFEQQLKFNQEYSVKKVTELIISNKRLKELSSFLNKLVDHSDAQGQKLIQDYVRMIKIELAETEEREWYLQFEKANPFFVEYLLQDEPSLTKKEIQICILVYLKLSNREISELLHNTESTIKTSRKRLRSKMGLSTDISFTDYLRENYIKRKPSNLQVTTAQNSTIEK